jgi:hypothetical protein
MKHWVSDFIRRARHVPGDPLPPEEPVSLTAVAIPTSGGVYFIQATAVENGPVKIGRTTNLRKRFGDLQTAHPWPLSLVGFIPLEDESGQIEQEAALHERFKHFRLQGEWFAAKVLEHVKVGL